MTGGVSSWYFWFATAGTFVFVAWLYWVSPRVVGKGAERNRALIIGIIFLLGLIIPDIWALTRLEGISWFVAWTMALLFVHIIEGGIWHRIVWGEKCPECKAWLDVFDEDVPEGGGKLRIAHRCPACGWTDSWAEYTKKTAGTEEIK